MLCAAQNQKSFPKWATIYYIFRQPGFFLPLPGFWGGFKRSLRGRSFKPGPVGPPYIANTSPRIASSRNATRVGAEWDPRGAGAARDAG